MALAAKDVPQCDRLERGSSLKVSEAHCSRATGSYLKTEGFTLLSENLSG